MLIGARKWLTLVLYGLSFSLAQGQTGILEQKINLDVENETLGETLKIIDQQLSSLSFSFNPEKIPARALVNYQARNLPLNDVLEYLAAK